MAETIKLTSLRLNEAAWPGTASELGIPTDGWDSTEWNFNTSDATRFANDPRSAPFPIGQKIRHYTDNSVCPGWYTMMYLAFHDFSTQDISVGEVSQGTAWCGHADGVACGTKVTFPGGDTTIAPYYFVSRCTTGSTDVTEGFGVCLPCTSMTADSSIVLVSDDPRGTGYGHGYGWFWVGGVCPVKDVTFLDNSANGGAAGSTPFVGADISCDPALMRAGPVIFEITSDGMVLYSTDLSNYADSTALGNTTTNVKMFTQGWADQSCT